MTNEEAVKHLRWFSEYNEEEYCGGDRIQKGADFYYYISKEDFEAFELAVKALEQSNEDCITCRVNSKTELDELKTELKNWKPELSELNHKLTFGECIVMAMSKITADLSEAAEKNWTEPQCEMLTRLICSVFMDKPYDEVTEEDMKQITEDIEK